MARQILIWNEESWYVAKDIETNVASQGKNRDEAKANLKEALELYFDGNDELSDNSNTPIYSVDTLEVM